MISDIDRTWFPFHRMTQGAQVRLFCFPYAGGGTVVFRRWMNNLPAWIDVFPLQLPGRENRFDEPLATDFFELVEQVGRIMLPLLDIPYALWGHSLGGLLSFEVARWLQQKSQPEPAHLFISASRAPHLPRLGEKASELIDAEFIGVLRRFNGTPEAVLQEPELLQLMLPILRADFHLVEQYHYKTGPAFNTPISAWGGMHDLEVSNEDLDAWRSHTRGDFCLRMFPGDHFFINTQTKVIAEMLTNELAKDLQAYSVHSSRKMAFTRTIPNVS